MSETNQDRRKNDIVVHERLATLEANMLNLVSGIGDVKELLTKHIDVPCKECSLNDDVAVCQNDVKWLKRIGYVVGGTCFTALCGLILDRFKIL